MKKLQILFVAVLAISMLGAGYAISLVTQTIHPCTVSVVVRYGNGPIKAYWDYDQNEPVLSIDFGTVVQDDSAYRGFYVFNENATYYSLVDWSSDIGVQTGAKITDRFTPDIHSYELGPGASVWVLYWIDVAPNTPVGPYTWTLNLGVV